MTSEASEHEYDIAVIGLAGRFPDAPDVDAFWGNLVANRVSLTRFTTEQLRSAGISEVLLSDPDYVPAAPVLDDAARFDAQFFGYSPRDAELIDPQQRQLLEVAWQALENAGYDPARFDGRIATFAGTAMNTYLLQSGVTERFFENYLPNLLGADKDFLATRIAYKLGLDGPAMTVQTACSTSLVAVHLACQSLLNSESDMALVGAAAVRAPLATGHLYEEGSVLARDAVCRPFDADAGGTVFGSGAGVVVLRRLNDALEAGDTISAVIKGTAVNNDGCSKSDFTAPSIDLQAAAVADALGAAGLQADDIDYVEAHGTGTFLGDPIEVEALSRAFRTDTQATGFCGLGSVKSNIGHLDAAAGIASLVKVVKSLNAELLPATANFRQPNPQIDFDATPFKVVGENQTWRRSKDRVRRAGISSLGMGGTNAHIVLEEAPYGFEQDLERGDGPIGPQILPLSALTDDALAARTDDLADHLEGNAKVRLDDVAYTLQQGRQAMARRKVLVADRAEEAAKLLRAGRAPSVVTSPTKVLPRNIAFMFPGQGSQYADMGATLYKHEAVFRQCMDRADAWLREHADLPLIDTLYSTTTEDRVNALNETATTQPALFAVEYAYARLLQSWGLEPAVLIGHSIGEYVAGAIADVFDEQTALHLVMQRGRAMQAAPRGDMLSIPLPVEEVQSLQQEGVDIAVVNSPESTVIAGTTEAIACARANLAQQGIACTLLRTSHAFHSHLMESAVQQFRAVLDKVELRAPKIPFISNVTGLFITDEQATDPSYWASQIRNTVQFQRGIETLFQEPALVFLEAGPGNTLTQLVNMHDERPDRHVAVAAGRHPKSDECDQRIAMRALGAAWVYGVDVDWSLVNQSKAQRIPLPTYRFSGELHWLSRSQPKVENAQNRPSLEADFACWASGWKAVPRLTRALPSGDRCVVIAPGDVAERLVNMLSPAFIAKGIALEAAVSCDQAVSVIENNSGLWHVVYIASATHSAPDRDPADQLQSLLSLARVIASKVAESSSLTLVHDRPLYEAGDSQVSLTGAALVSALSVIAREYSGLHTRALEVPDVEQLDVVGALGAKLTSAIDEPISAFRYNTWWTPAHEKISLPEVGDDSVFDNGAQVIVGASGGIGRALAAKLATCCDDLVLVGRSMPEDWTCTETDSVAASAVAAQDESTAGTLAFLDSLKGRRARVHVIRAGLATQDDMDRLAACLGTLDVSIGHIFHLAGKTLDGLVETKQLATVKEVLAPKVEGSELLLNLAERVAADRLVLFSSTAAIAGPVGQVDYAFANEYQRLLAGTERGAKVCTIAWPGWRDTGMLSRLGGTVDASIELNALEPAVGLQWLSRILAACAIDDSVSNVVLSRVPLDKLAELPSLPLDSDNAAAQSGDQAVLDDDPKSIVRRLCSDLLGVETIEDDDNFYDLGGNSLLVTQLVARLRKRHGIDLPLAAALGSPVLNDWLETVAEKSPSTAIAAGGEERAGQIISESSLAPVGRLGPIAGLQRYVERRPGVMLHQWNLSTLLVLVEPLTIETVERAVLAVVNHHDMLRACIQYVGHQLVVEVLPELSTPPLVRVDLSSIDSSALEAEITNRANVLQAGFSLEHGKLFQVAMFDCGPGRPDRLLIFGHHFITDGLSWTVTLSDLQAACKSVAAGKVPSLPEKTTSYRAWAAAMQDASDNMALEGVASDWMGLPWHQLKPIPEPESTSTNNLNRSAAVLDVVLDRGASARLDSVVAQGASVEEAALLALGRAISAWARSEAVLIDVMGLGRDVSDAFDVSRTVGYFNSYAPVLFSPGLHRDIGNDIGEQCCAFRSWLARGNEHDLLRHVCSDEKIRMAMSSLPIARVLFNYIGKLKSSNDELLDEQLWRIANESGGSGHHPEGRRDHAIAVRLELVGDRYVATFVYSSDLHDALTIAKLRDRFVVELEALHTVSEAAVAEV